jgi:hypothetical protein
MYYKYNLYSRLKTSSCITAVYIHIFQQHSNIIHKTYLLQIAPVQINHTIINN